MATYVKFNITTYDMLNGSHHFASGGDAYKVMLTNTAPVAATNVVYGDLTDLSTSGGYTAGGASTTSSLSTSSGTAKVTMTDVVFTATTGGFGPFRYAVLYNNTTSSPNKPLVAYWDYGSSISLLDGETFTVDFDGSAGVLTLT